MAFTDFNSPDEVQKAYSITYADKSLQVIPELNVSLRKIPHAPNKTNSRQLHLLRTADEKPLTVSFIAERNKNKQNDQARAYSILA
jgi:plasmid maintenance system killer protein